MYIYIRPAEAALEAAADALRPAEAALEAAAAAEQPEGDTGAETPAQ